LNAIALRAYLAGIIDGEGTITITSHTNRDRVYLPKITINMCDPQAMELLADRYGGKVYAKPSRFENSRDQFIWAVTGSHSLNIIEDLKEFLLIKKPQAEVVLSADWTIHNRWSITDEVKESRRSAYEKILLLNKRGIH
jgi:hypothetical protein